MDEDELNIFELLDTVSVESGEGYEVAGLIPKGWYAVSIGCPLLDDGITACFRRETDAFRFRLDLINRRMNP